MVHLGPGLRREPGVEGFPDQRVPEPVHLADLLARAEQADGGGVVAQPGHRFGRGAQRRRDQGRVDALPERRGGGEDVFRGRRAVAGLGLAGSGVAEPGELAADGLPDAGRDRHLLDRGHAGPEQARHLGYEQRVALAAALDHGEHVGARAGQHELDVPGGKARQDQRRAGRLQRGDHVADVRVEGRLGGAVGGEQHDPGQPCGRREAQQQGRRPPGGVQVVKDHGQRGGPRRVVQEGADGLEQCQPGPGPGPGPGRGGLVGRAELGEELAEHGGLRADRVGERLRPGLPGVAPQHLHPGPVGRGAAVFPRTAPEHERAVLGGRPGEGAGQFGLADARLARDQRQPGVTGGRLAQGSGEDGELT